MTHFSSTTLQTMITSLFSWVICHDMTSGTNPSPTEFGILHRMDSYVAFCRKMCFCRNIIVAGASPLPSHLRACRSTCFRRGTLPCPGRSICTVSSGVPSGSCSTTAPSPLWCRSSTWKGRCSPTSRGTRDKLWNQENVAHQHQDGFSHSGENIVHRTYIFFGDPLSLA